MLLVDTFGRAWCIRQIPGIGIVSNNNTRVDRALDWIGFVDPSLIILFTETSISSIHGLICNISHNHQSPYLAVERCLRRGLRSL